MSTWRDIDWRQPWFAPYRAAGEAVCGLLGRGASTAAALDELAEPARPALLAGPVRFVAHQALPDGEAYEAFIHRTAQVPTRDNLHDLFNGLVWLTFPDIKRRLNELQASCIARVGVATARGAVRDALTLFDENAVLWEADEPLLGALRARDWHGLFVDRRDEWAASRVIVFGHALLDKLVRPRPAITAHAWRLRPGPSIAQFIDEELREERLRERPWLPLPVLGVPGWWTANESPSFYADTAVFRPARAIP